MNERRKSPAAAENTTRKQSLFAMPFLLMNRFKLYDILSTRQHSEDFIETRAEYILVRLRFMIFFYVIAVPLWTPIDYLLVSQEHFAHLTILKLLLSAALLPLGLLTLRRLSSNQVHVVFFLTILVAGMFYFASMWVLNQGAPEVPLAGYTLMPLMMVAMLGVFPLTVAWGVILIALILVIYLGLQVTLGQLITLDTINMLWIFLILGGISLWIQASQQLMLLKLYRESTQDPLTGMINRRVLMKRLVTEIEQVSKGAPSFCILMFDLDRFKRINDNYGHLTGDEVLKTTATILQQELRGNDIVARFGGEEFVAVLPRTDLKLAIDVAERIREACYVAKTTAPNGDEIPLRTSVGVTRYEAGEAIESTLNRVDEALYQAKETGRNKVVHRQSDVQTQVE
jgi:diguanylate cyclase (GGDEF)-like protein